MKTAREYAHDLVNWDGMHHCGPRTHSPTCDKGTEAFEGLRRRCIAADLAALAAMGIAGDMERELAAARKRIEELERMVNGDVG